MSKQAMVIAKRIDDEKKMKEKKKSDVEKKAADKNHKCRLDPGSTGAAASRCRSGCSRWSTSG